VLCVRNSITAGDGIAGPITALALQKAGIASAICEASPGPGAEIGACFTIATNGLDAPAGERSLADVA
jgi:2-polyprenyl-6-methoxyphenol hydroxylase-like FAD-dependent oxidoreductase